MTEICYAIILGGFGLIQGVAVAIIAGIFSLKSKRVEKQVALLAKESQHSMHLMSACASIAHATGLAVKEKRANGKMDSALAELETARRGYFNFINSVAASKLTGGG